MEINKDASHLQDKINLLNTIYDQYNITNTESISSFGDFIFNQVKEFYNTELITSLKPKETEWTVFASIILQNNKDMKPIVFTNGTKSLPNKNYNFRTYRVKDCHAEILALRCLKSFLLKCLAFNLIKCHQTVNSEILKNSPILSEEEFSYFNQHEDFFSIFDFSEKNKKIKLKDKILFHLYVSELPCGDCSIHKSTINNREDVNQTGSKIINEVMILINNANENKIKKLPKINHDNSLGKFRSKSMRNDMDIDSISFSLSCSDKLLFKNILGVQGKLLSSIMSPIYLSSIIISNCDSNNKGINKSIERGVNLSERLNYLNSDQIEQLKVECLDKEFRKNSFVFNQPQIILVNESLIRGRGSEIKNSVSFSFYWYFSKSIFTKIDPGSGMKLGTNNNQPNKEKSRVNISRFDFIFQFGKLLELYSSDSLSSINLKKCNDIIIKINNFERESEGAVDVENFYDKINDNYYLKLKDNLEQIFDLKDFLNHNKCSYKK